MAIPFDCSKPNLHAARQIFLEAIAADAHFNQLGGGTQHCDPYVEYIGPSVPKVLAWKIHQAFWQLFLEGIVAPGLNADNNRLPWFHITDYGREVLSGLDLPVHDPERYLERLAARVPSFDPTVRSYLGESLATFARGNLVSSAVMLGIASERVFLLLCETVLAVLSNPGEQQKFKRICAAYAMKPKLDWLTEKFQQSAVKSLTGFPDNAHVALLAVFDFLRVQRNDLGHPATLPPSIEREDVYSNLQVFARYYQTVEAARTVISSNQL